jgi:quercetin 2,3-dioxygenase
MPQHRPINELGGDNFGWLKARHHFAAGVATNNPAHTALKNLIVWNDDGIKPGKPALTVEVNMSIEVASQNWTRR